jgi:paraquat-inducible protein B
VSDAIEPPPLPQASARRARRVSVIWLVPLVAIAIGAWLAWDTLSKRGPRITISFETAEGLQPGQSQLKFKDIVFGTVSGVALSPDHTRALVTVATTREAAPLLTDKTLFWVVKPRLFAGNLSGLETLVSGSYIGMLPPPSGGNPQTEFVGREDPPVLEAAVAGRTFLVTAKRLGSISLGSPVFFRDLDVGEVLGWDIADMAESVTIHVFVRAPFDGYVHDGSRFWNASGVSVKLGGTGVDVQFESLRAIVLGGIAFETPTTAGQGNVSVENHVFPLFPDQDAANNASYTRKIPLVSYFPGSVRGLGPGSEVTIHGLVVGHVLGVRLRYDADRDAIVAPVRYEVEPERIVGIGATSVYATAADAVNDLVKRGLRATLDSASLITGQQFVALDFVPNAPPAAAGREGEDFVLPTTEGGGFASLQASATQLLENVNNIPFKQIGDSLDGILRAANNIANGAELRQTLTGLSVTIGKAKDLLQHIDDGVAPTMRQLPEVATTLQKTLTNANRLVLSLDNGYGDNTKFNRDLARLLVQLNEALGSIRSLADLLARHPEALIKGRPAGGLE